MVTVIEVITAITTIPFTLAPTQTIRIGARAVLGRAFKTTRNGSRTFANLSDHQRQMAINSPPSVPIINPTSVSYNEIPKCLKISPFSIYLISKFQIADGLLKKKSSIIP